MANNGATGHAFYSKPVNFGDQESPYNDPYDTKTRTVTDNSSFRTYQTSGILAADTSGKKNEHGQTEAQIVAFDYQLSSPRSPTSSDPLARKPSNASAHRKSFAPSNTDALTYIDEDFNYYPSRAKNSSTDRDSALLVANAADMGRKDRESRGFDDLGTRQHISNHFCKLQP